MSSELHPDVLRELLAVLATVEVAYLPFRHLPSLDPATAAAIVERRRLYRQHGLPVVVEGGGNAMAHSRRLNVLRRLGYVRTAGKTRGVTVQLTPVGDDYARLRAPTSHVYDSAPWALLGRLAKPLPDDVTNAGFVHERCLAAVPFGRAAKSSEFYALEESATPLLCRGWAKSTSDARGHLGYRITDAGRDALLGGRRALQEADYRGGEVADWYIDLFSRLLQERERWTPVEGKDVAIPLSAGLWMTEQEQTQTQTP